MTITINDLKRAILQSGDVSSFADVYRRALADPPVDIVSDLATLIPLPQHTVLLNSIDEQLSGLFSHFENAEEATEKSLEGIDLELAALSRHGNNSGKYVHRIIHETNPDIIAVDASPAELGAHMRYACSLPYAVGLPIQTQIFKRDTGKKYAGGVYYPSSTIGITAIESWLHKIPVLPIGSPLKPIQMEFDPWGGQIDPDYVDRNTWESKQYVAHETFEYSVNADTGLQEGNDFARTAAYKLLETLDGRRRDSVLEEAGYVSSRIMDIAACARLSGRKIRVLALIDITHYVDLAFIASQMYQGTTNYFYIPRGTEAADGTMVMTGKVFDNPDGTGKTPAQELFQGQFDRHVKAKDSEILTESKVNGLLAEIGERVRTHQDVAGGLSVRGTIAFKEILGGLSEINGNVTQKNLVKAAFITLPPRITLKRKGDVVSINGDVKKEVLYRINF